MVFELVNTQYRPWWNFKYSEWHFPNWNKVFYQVTSPGVYHSPELEKNIALFYCFITCSTKYKIVAPPDQCSSPVLLASLSPPVSTSSTLSWGEHHRPLPAPLLLPLEAGGCLQHQQGGLASLPALGGLAVWRPDQVSQYTIQTNTYFSMQCTGIQGD